MPIQLIPAGEEMDIASPVQEPKRGRGRPPGSKNKPTNPIPEPMTSESEAPDPVDPEPEAPGPVPPESVVPEPEPPWAS